MVGGQPNSTTPSPGFCKAIIDSGTNIHHTPVDLSAHTGFIKETINLSHNDSAGAPYVSVGYLPNWNGFKRVYYVPTAVKTLISEGALYKGGYGITRTPTGDMSITSPAGDHMFNIPLNPHSLLLEFEMPVSPPQANLCGGEFENVAMSWHHRLGHPSDAILMAMNRSGAFGKRIPEKNFKEMLLCEACCLGKSTRAVKPKTAHREATGPYQQFSIDICHFRAKGRNGETCSLLIWDKYSGKISNYNLRTRSEALGALKNFFAKHRLKDTNAQMQIVMRSDNAQEFLSRKVHALCDEYGVTIRRELSCAFSSFQNGGAERAI